MQPSPADEERDTQDRHLHDARFTVGLGLVDVDDGLCVVADGYGALQYANHEGDDEAQEHIQVDERGIAEVGQLLAHQVLVCHLCQHHRQRDRAAVGKVRGRDKVAHECGAGDHCHGHDDVEHPVRDLPFDVNVHEEQRVPVSARRR